MNPDHLFEQAERLIASSTGGPQRRVDIKRAMSAAYYGLFHFVLRSTGDAFVGASQRSTSHYSLLYRSIDHRALLTLCLEIGKSDPARKYLPYCPAGGFETGMKAFAEATIDLQRKRHLADYDPQSRFRTSDARLAIELARSAVKQFQSAQETHRSAFLTMLLCPPR